MKVFALPTELAKTVPAWNINLDREANFQAETDHKAAVAQWMKDNGFTGKHTGRIYSASVADGSAEYMIAHAGRGTGRSTCVFHLPYGDAYQDRAIGHMAFGAVLEVVDSIEAMNALFEKNKPVETPGADLLKRNAANA